MRPALCRAAAARAEAGQKRRRRHSWHFQDATVHSRQRLLAAMAVAVAAAAEAAVGRDDELAAHVVGSLHDREQRTSHKNVTQAKQLSQLDNEAPRE